MVRTIEGDIIVADDDGEVLTDHDDEDDDRVDPDDEGVELLTDGGRPALSSFDHAPTVGPSDVDKCRECGRYAPHAFDHAPDCSRFESIDDELSSRTAASNSRMVKPTTDGGKDPVFEREPQSPEQIASNIVAATEGDDVLVWCVQGDPDGVLSIFEGTVESTTYREHDAGGEHVLTVDVNGDTLSVTFGRTIDPDDDSLSEPDPEAHDPTHDVVWPVTRFEGVDG